jgi:hypothetical protein
MLNGRSIVVELAEYMVRYPAEPFNWRSNNCCHFVAQWVEHMTQFNPMSGLPETGSAGDALRLIRSLGGSFRAAWTHRLGVEPCGPERAEIGDVVMFPTAPHLGEGCCGVGGLVGICCGDTVAVIDDSGVIRYLSMQDAYCGWSLRQVVASLDGGRP